MHIHYKLINLKLRFKKLDIFEIFNIFQYFQVIFKKKLLFLNQEINILGIK